VYEPSLSPLKTIFKEPITYRLNTRHVVSDYLGVNTPHCQGSTDLDHQCCGIAVQPESVKVVDNKESDENDE